MHIYIYLYIYIYIFFEKKDTLHIIVIVYLKYEDTQYYTIRQLK